ncbi:MAG: hypothetical protein AUF79_03755 [Crenarchaeota archaeon 13_1_20CM_2_51_8]|nr:MAG: hypothetical protein AUF79_03755 [Crenarchaeota archaeon 13_1_20CM_2_51_8]
MGSEPRCASVFDSNVVWSWNKFNFSEKRSDTIQSFNPDGAPRKGAMKQVPKYEKLKTQNEKDTKP